MKKFLSLLLAIAMLTALCACGMGAELSRGTVVGDVYQSEYLGLKFEKPSSWVYSTDEEIASAINVAVDTLLDENFAKAMENNPTVYDMMVVDMKTRTNISVGYENLKKTMATNVTIEQYIDALKDQFANVTGMKISFRGEPETAKLGNVEFTRCICDTTAKGVKMTQVYYLRKMDSYMAMVIATIPSGYTVADIEAMFS